MDLNKENAKQLSQQLQDAHRFSVGYYQRFLGLINRAAEELGFEFEMWEPTRFNKPCRASTNPANKYAWDLLPMSCTRFVFVGNKEDVTNKGDLFLEIVFVPDPAMIDIKGQPDPMSLKEEPPQIELYAFKSKAKFKDNIWQAWKKNDGEYPDEEVVLTHYDNAFIGIGVTEPIEKFLVDPKYLINILINAVNTEKT